MSDKNIDDQKRKPSALYAVPFFAVLALISVISFIIPLRPTVSYQEKRELAKFPAFSIETLLSGDYFDELTLWYSDTFPGREEWIQLSRYADSFHGYSEIAIEGMLPETDMIPPVMQTQNTVTPSPGEQVQTPEPTNEPSMPASGQETEETAEQTEDTQPTEAHWGGVDAGDAAEILQSGTAIQIGDSAFLALGFSQVNSEAYTKAVNDFAARVADLDVTVVSAPPPTSVGVMVEEEYLPDLNCVSQVELIGYMHSGMQEGIVTVDLAAALIEHNDEYLFFRTDHHWTALGAYYSYVAVCNALDLPYVDIDTMEVMPQGEFVGSIYADVSRPHKLKKDTVDAYIPEGDIRHQIHDQNGYVRDWPLLIDKSDQDVNTKYIVFGSDFPMTHTVNDSIPDAPNCLIIKDSFGNPLVPFMSQTFHQVYAIDYRKYYGIPICDLIEKYEIDYVLFMPNLMATQASGGPGMIRGVALAYY